MRQSRPDSPDISVVVLCYKEGLAAKNFIEELKKSLEERRISYELIPVANNYPGEEIGDPTPGVLKDLTRKYPCIRPVCVTKKGGFGWDVRSGLSLASGRTIAFIDGDGQMPAADVLRVYDALLESNCDMAQTFRVKRSDNLQRIFISRIYNVLAKILFPKISIFDMNSKPKIFTRQALNKLNLKSDDWFIDAEIVIQAANLGFTIAQVPTIFHKSRGRPSYVKLPAIFEFLKNLIRYRFKN